MSGIVISGNTITNSDQGLRIKTKADATSASVTNVTYSGNTGSGLREFGVLIDQVSRCARQRRAIMLTHPHRATPTPSALPALAARSLCVPPSNL